MIFIVGAGGVMAAAIADKLAENYGSPRVGIVTRGIMAIVAAGAIVWFLSTGMGAFL